jgi:superfamily II DNA or RNA helicase
MIKLRKSQQDLVDKTKLNKSNLLVAFTSFGKSYVIYGLISQKSQTKVLILSDQRNLVIQLAELYKDNHTFILSGKTFDHSKQVHIGTLQTLNNREVNLDEYDLIIQDEADRRHNTKQIKELKGKAKTFVGLTGTPLTNRNKLLTGFDNIAFGLSINEGFKQDLLVKPLIVSRGDTIEKYKPELLTKQQDYEPETVRRIISKEKLLNTIAKSIIDRDLSNNKKVAVYVDFIDTANQLYDMLKHLPNIYILHSKLPQRQQDKNFNDFKQAKYGVIVNVRSLSRGIDIVDLNHIILGIYTKIHSLLFQILGRVYRLDPNNTNKTSTIEDFTGVLQGEDSINPFTDFSEYKEKKNCEEECLKAHGEDTFDYEICMDTCLQTDSPLIFCSNEPKILKKDPYRNDYKLIEGKSCKSGSPVWEWKFKTTKKPNSFNLYKWSKCPVCGSIYRYELQTLKDSPENMIVKYYEDSDLDVAYFLYNKEIRRAVVLINSSQYNTIRQKFVDTPEEAMSFMNKQFKGKQFHILSNIKLNYFPNHVVRDEFNNWVELIEWDKENANITRRTIKLLLTETTKEVGFKAGMVFYLMQSVNNKNERKILTYLLNNDITTKQEFNKLRYDYIEKPLK